MKNSKEHTLSMHVIFFGSPYPARLSSRNSRKVVSQPRSGIFVFQVMA